MISKDDTIKILKEEKYFVACSDIYSGRENPTYLGRIEEDGRINPAWGPSPSNKLAEGLSRLRRTCKEYALQIIDNPAFRKEIAQNMKLASKRLEGDSLKNLEELIANLIID